MQKFLKELSKLYFSDSSSPIDDFADDTINECKSEWGKEMPYIKGKGKPLSLKQRTKPKGLLPLAPQDVSPPSIDMDPAREQKTQDFLFSKDGKELNKVAMPIQNEIRKGKFISESAEKLQPEPYEEQETQKHSDQKFRNFLHLQKIPYKYSRPLFGRKARSAECSQEIASFRKQLLAKKPFQTSLREWKIVGIHEQPEQRYSIENFQQSKEKFTYSYEGMQQEGLFSNEATQESLEEADVGVEFKGKKMLPLGEKTSSIEEKHNLPKPSRRKKKVSSEDHSLDKTESYSEEHCNKVKRTDQLNFHKPVSLKHHVARHHNGHDLLRGTKKKASPGLKKTSSPHRLAVQKAMIRNRDLIYKQKGDAQKGSKEQLSKENISAQKIARRENRPSKVLIGNAKHDFRQSAHSPKKVKQTARQSKQSQSKLKDLHRQSQDTPKYKIHSRQKGVRRVDGR
ncbi:hypothetical protein ANCCAN_19388 [Ancylostoma caninum]|uniref:Uncharacterized protein n=1 Tax=Ancylostoma caninum TaxID=29170 RepID=A0A368FRI6_ANCCA|nr:hypothetical protein ANCCAN_19388 [Ancylostoma caninum]